MNTASLEPPRWTRRQWLYTIAATFLMQAGLISFLAERTQPVLVQPQFPTTIQLAADPAVLQQVAASPTLGDPAVFALPNLHGFSAAAWLTFAPVIYPLRDWTEPPSWLALGEQDLGASFAAFVATNATPPLRIADKPLSPLTASEIYSRPEPLSARSELRIEGDLAGRRLLEPLALPSWPHTDVLTNTVVQLLVDAEGRAISATLLGGSGLKLADDFALKAAGGARFRPLRGPQRRTQAGLLLSRGNLIFQWHAMPPAMTNGALLLP